MVLCRDYRKLISKTKAFFNSAGLWADWVFQIE